MKFTIEASELARVFETAARGSATRTAVEVLRGSRLEASGGTLAVCGTDLDVAVFARAKYRPAKGKAGDRVAVVGPAAQLLRAVKTLDGDVELETGGGKLLLRSGRAALSFDLYVEADFPTVLDEGEVLCSLPAEQFLGLFASVRRCYSRDESRPVLTGVLLEHVAGKTLTLAATDSYRLAVDAMPSGLEDAWEVIVPGASLEMVAKLARKSERIQLVRRGAKSGPHWFGFQADDVSVWAREIDGQFPAWRQLLPDYADGDSYVTFDRAEAIKALKRIDVLATRNQPVTVEAAPGEPLRFSLSQHDGASISDEVDADAQLEGELRIGFNVPFLIDALEMLPDVRVRMVATSGLRPAIFRGESAEPWYLLMPIRLADAYAVAA